jgi:hypothetical protein
MQELFSQKFFDELRSDYYTIYKVEENLFQARFNLQVIILWKVNNGWEGAGNIDTSSLVDKIGAAIDEFYSQKEKNSKVG